MCIYAHICYISLLTWCCTWYLVYNIILCTSIFIWSLLCLLPLINIWKSTCALYHICNIIHSYFLYSPDIMPPMICDVYCTCFILPVNDYPSHDLVISYSSWSLPFSTCHIMGMSFACLLHVVLADSRLPYTCYTLSEIFMLLWYEILHDVLFIINE